MNDEEQNQNWDEVEDAVEMLEQGELEEAKAFLLHVVEANQSNEYAHFFLGNAYFELREYERALRCYVSALEVKPDYAGALVASGHTLRLLGKLDPAVRVGKQLLLQKPEDPDALFLLGLALHARGDSEEARGYLQRFVDTKPELEASLEARAILEAIDGAPRSS